MKKHTLSDRVWTVAAVLPVFALVIILAACGGKEAASGGNGSGGSGSESTAVSNDAPGTAGSGSGISASGSGSTNTGAGSAGGSDSMGQAAQAFASQYGVDMPDGIVSLADPNAIYDAGSMIQMDGTELYISAEEASDWIDSKTGLSDGMKYISVELELTDYDAGMVKELPAPEHYYLIEAKDEYGNLVDLSAAGGTDSMLRPVTDMPVSEIRSDADQYYCSAEPYNGGELDRWLLYQVPEETREVVIACWLTDQFSQPHNAAFRLNVQEKHENHTFENMEGMEIQKLLDTSEQPTLEDFAWYTSPSVFADRTVGDYRDPEYDAREYLGGWKCYIFRDARTAGRGFEAHLCNLYVDNYQPEDEYEKGYVDVRIDWYLGIDGEGNVIDESGLSDAVCTHEEFYYNRMENEDSSYPFASFSFEYTQDAAIGRGRYVNENKEEYMMALVRPDGEKIWIMDGSRPSLTVMPGTSDVPVPVSLQPTGSASANITTESSDLPAGIPGGATEAVTQTQQSDGSSGSNAAASGEVSLDDFNWYFNDEFPIDGRPLTELQDLGGKWKGILNVVTPVDGEDQCRIMVCDAEVQYMGYKVTVLLHPTETHEFMVSDPGSIESKKLNVPDNIVMNGDWDDDPGYFDVTSETSSLNMMVYDFVEAGGMQYALGTVYNGEKEIGEVAMVR
ncbi:MAG: hypothetical protein IJR62_07630 [Lachnospiraceae bacterium]|jgi:hypothetical protein|nr:hypothetical protein [Lachnospiraceae bacterium]